MKVFYKVFAATAALATLVATNTMADRYHAKSVQCRTGVSESVTTLEWLGVNEDSVEIWGAQKDNDNHAYFWCDIDGNSFSVPETNIEGNVEHTLVEIGFWEKMLLRKIPSGYNQTLFVRVKSNKSGDNKFMSFNDAEVDTFWNVDPWLLRDIEVPVKLEDSPTYDPTTNQFTQTISWEYKNFGKTVMGSLQLYVSYDKGASWSVLTSMAYSDYDFRKHKTTVTLPGDKESVSYMFKFKPRQDRWFLIENTCLYTEPTTPVELSKTPVSPTPGGGGTGSLVVDTTVVQGINTAETVKAQKHVDVYDLTGACVARGVTLEKASASLRRGVYVVDKKKVMLGK